MFEAESPCQTSRFSPCGRFLISLNSNDQKPFSGNCCIRPGRKCHLRQSRKIVFLNICNAFYLPWPNILLLTESSTITAGFYVVYSIHYKCGRSLLYISLENLQVLGAWMALTKMHHCTGIAMRVRMQLQIEPKFYPRFGYKPQPPRCIQNRALSIVTLD